MTNNNTLESLNMNSTLNYSTLQNYGSNWYDWEYWQSYPVYSSCWHSDSKNTFEAAFKIVSKLLEKKIIKSLTLKQFIDLVNEVQKLV